MTPAASLYVGKTTHARGGSRPHRFTYGVFQLLIDIDRVEAAVRGVRLISHARFGLFTFAEQDHGARDGAPLRPWVEAQLASAGLVVSARRIRLLTFPRVLGFVFNPISIFFVEGDDGALEAVIYEVNNTFGQTHAYVAPAGGGPCERQEADKKLFVSPFHGVEGVYQFLITPPGERFDLVITKRVGGRPDFTATLAATRRKLTDRALLSLFVAMPLMTLGVVGAIHWQALRLWLKGAKLHPRPKGAPAGVSAGRALPPMRAIVGSRGAPGATS